MSGDFERIILEVQLLSPGDRESPRLYLESRTQAGNGSTAQAPEFAQAPKSIVEEIGALVARDPEEEFERLPRDGAQPGMITDAEPWEDAEFLDEARGMPGEAWSPEEVRAALTGIPGNLADDVRAERDERG